MELLSLEKELKENSYPGRGIVIGRSQDGTKAVTAYFIMGRSENSRNRVFVEEGQGIRTQAFDPSKLTDPSLIIYAPVRVLGNRTIVTNGDQTDTIYEGMDQELTFEQSLRCREFEPDAPNYTPRISGVMHIENGRYDFAMSILKSNNGDPDCCQRFTFSYDKPKAGEGISVMLLGLAFGILVGSPIEVGASRFFMRTREESTGMGELFWAFRQGQFWHIVLIMLVMKVKIFLWGLLFVIPGIVKSYEYRMVPYILAENPNLQMSEVFALSREMTMNQKMNIFVLDLSFIPWQLLSSVTLGLAGIFWVNPYTRATEAELYAVLRQNVLDSGFANGFTLPGFGSGTGTF